MKGELTTNQKARIIGALKSLQDASVGERTDAQLKAALTEAAAKIKNVLRDG